MTPWFLLQCIGPTAATEAALLRKYDLFKQNIFKTSELKSLGKEEEILSLSEAKEHGRLRISPWKNTIEVTTVHMNSTHQLRLSW